MVATSLPISRPPDPPAMTSWRPDPPSTTSWRPDPPARCRKLYRRTPWQHSSMRASCKCEGHQGGAAPLLLPCHLGQPPFSPSLLCFLISPPSDFFVCVQVAPSCCCRWTRTSSSPPLHPTPPPTPTCAPSYLYMVVIHRCYYRDVAPYFPRIVFDPVLLLLGTQQGMSHGASSLLRPSLLLSDLGYGRDGRHQATAAGQGPSSATPTTHERRICSCLLLQDAMEVMVVVAQVKPKIVETRTILLVVVSQVKPWSGFCTSGSLAQSLEVNK